jgi:hypothetical protein
MKGCQASRERYGVRLGMAVLIVGGISLLFGRALASEISHSDYYDYSMKSFFIEKISLEADSLRIQAGSLDPKITNFEFTINGQPAPGGIVRLPQTIEPKRYDFHALIKPAGGGPEEEVDFSLYPTQLYAQGGRMKEPSYIIIHRSTVATHRPVYVYHAPAFSAADLAFARETWGGLRTAPMSDIALAQAIERDIILRLEPHRGIPSDVMNTSSPRVQFERAMSGRDRVWCGNLAAIFRFACASLGLDVRVIHTGAEYLPAGRHVKFLSLESHGTVEVFSRETKTWFWIDPTGYVLEATIDGAPLTLLQIVEGLGTPLEDRIMIATFDAKKNERVELPLAQSPAAAFMKNYFRPSVRLKY